MTASQPERAAIWARVSGGSYGYRLPGFVACARCPFASLTDSLTLVHRIVRVPLGTVRFGTISGAYAPATCIVHCGANRFQVSRIDTSPVAAQVIHVEALRDWPIPVSVRPPVRSTMVEPPISPNQKPIPQPAIVWRYRDVTHEAHFLRCWRSVVRVHKIRVSVLEPTLIVKPAPLSRQHRSLAQGTHHTNEGYRH